MANTQAQFGFQQFGYLPGGAPDYQLSKYAIQSTYATAIYFGDPVIKSAGGVGGAGGVYIKPMTTNVGTVICGIFQGCMYTPSGGYPTWYPWYPAAAAGADAVAYVIDAPNALFRAATLLTALGPGTIGQLVGFSTGAGGTTTGGGFSSYVIDQSTATIATTTLAFQVYGMYPGVGNGSDTSSNYNWVIVNFARQRFQTGGGGLGS